MESNGKYVDRNGQKVTYQTGRLFGVNQEQMVSTLLPVDSPGNQAYPCDFMAPAISHNPLSDHHPKLLANFFAQTEALMVGKTPAQVEAELKAAGKSAEEVAALLPFKVFEGNFQPIQSCSRS